MKVKKSEFRAEATPVTDKPIENTPTMSHELTIHCLVCNYKQGHGGLDAPANLSSDEVLSLSKHNPRCQTQIQGNYVVSVSSDVSTSDTSHVTHYLIQLA